MSKRKVMTPRKKGSIKKSAIKKAVKSTDNKHQTYASKQKKKGLKLIAVWCPKKDVVKAKRYIVRTLLRF